MARNKKFEAEMAAIKKDLSTHATAEVKQKPVKEDPIKVLQESVNHLIEIVSRLESRFDRLGGGF